MYEFLMQGVNFNGYPSKLSQRHFRGMPMPTYEALLQNINTHIQLYQYAHGNTYNVHSISTLANESFFSDLTQLDKESPFYPKACNIPKLVGKVVQLNYYKHRQISLTLCNLQQRAHIQFMCLIKSLHWKLVTLNIFTRIISLILLTPT